MGRGSGVTESSAGGASSHSHTLVGICSLIGRGGKLYYTLNCYGFFSHSFKCFGLEHIIELSELNTVMIRGVPNTHPVYG